MGNETMDTMQLTTLDKLTLVFNLIILPILTSAGITFGLLSIDNAISPGPLWLVILVLFLVFYIICFCVILAGWMFFKGVSI